MKSQADNHSDLPPVIDVITVAHHEPVPLSGEELADLRRARALLSSPGVAIRMANLIGSPIEKGVRLLPERAARLVHRATHAALVRSLQIALNSLDAGQPSRPENQFHKVLIGTSGAVGGAFGLPALLVELPVSTTLILRSIAQIAASQGHDLRVQETRLGCLEVFALGGDTTADNAAETSYWAIRTALARMMSGAAGNVIGRLAMLDTSSVTLRLISAVASRFGVVLSEQIAAKAVPVAGAAAGAAINVVFMDHFQKMAEGHFIVRRLERIHGASVVRRAYESFGVHTA
jgi:hypothetical protein